MSSILGVSETNEKRIREYREQERTSQAVLYSQPDECDCYSIEDHVSSADRYDPAISRNCNERG